MGFCMHSSSVITWPYICGEVISQPCSQFLSSSCPPGVREERPWHRLVTCDFDNIENIRDASSLITLNFVRFKASHYDWHYPQCLKTISNSIYSNVYLKIKQVCLEAIYRGCDIVAVLPTGYTESQLYFNFFLCCSVTRSTVDVEQCNLIP